MSWSLTGLSIVERRHVEGCNGPKIGRESEMAVIQVNHGIPEVFCDARVGKSRQGIVTYFHEQQGQHVCVKSPS